MTWEEQATAFCQRGLLMLLWDTLDLRTQSHREERGSQGHSRSRCSTRSVEVLQFSEACSCVIRRSLGDNREQSTGQGL